jgi:hypothetical protein
MAIFINKIHKKVKSSILPPPLYAFINLIINTLHPLAKCNKSDTKCDISNISE